MAHPNPPYLLGMMLRTQAPLACAYAGYDSFVYHTPPVRPLDYRFPHIQVDDLSNVDRVIRPLCDQAHQMFGIAGSPSFSPEGAWTVR